MDSQWKEQIFDVYKERTLASISIQWTHAHNNFYFLKVGVVEHACNTGLEKEVDQKA